MAEGKRRKKHTKEEREKLLKDYKSSGKSKIDWSKEAGISSRTVTNWLKDVETETYDKKEMKEMKESKGIKKPTFIELKPVPKKQEQSNKANKPIQIQIGKIKLELSGDYDIEVLNKIFKVVLEVC